MPKPRQDDHRDPPKAVREARIYELMAQFDIDTSYMLSLFPDLEMTGRSRITTWPETARHAINSFVTPRLEGENFLTAGKRRLTCLLVMEAILADMQQSFLDGVDEAIVQVTREWRSPRERDEPS